MLGCSWGSKRWAGAPPHSCGWWPGASLGSLWQRQSQLAVRAVSLWSSEHPADRPGPGEGLAPSSKDRGQGHLWLEVITPPPAQWREAQADAITSALRMAGLLAPDSLEATGCAPVMGWEGVGSPSASASKQSLT